VSGETLEARALAALNPEALLADVAAIVSVPRVTGEEREAMQLFAQRAGVLGLRAELIEHDLAALRAHPDHPGEEAARDELVGVTLTAAGRDPGARRLCLNGHLDVVGPGTEPWELGPWSGIVRDGRLYGRGSADMTGAVVALMHAVAAVATTGGSVGDIVVQAVGSEEDGGLGTFAALQADADFAACLIPEPTAFDVACAQAGALTFSGLIPGVSAHAGLRLEGASAIDRYVPVHGALAELERELNAGVDHPLMSVLPLPYPVSVGRVAGGTWSSSVPDRLKFEGRVGVPVGTQPAAVRRRLEEVVARACPQAHITWTGGSFSPGETALQDPFAQLVLGAAGAELDRPARAIGVPYGADMRQFCARGIPCVMLGTPGLDQAHAVDEHVDVEALLMLSRMLVRVIARF
jgi:acetylornithine deacetylase